MVEMASAHEPALLEAHRQLVIGSFSMPAFEAAFMAALRLAVSRNGTVPDAASNAAQEPVGRNGAA